MQWEFQLSGKTFSVHQLALLPLNKTSLPCWVSEHKTTNQFIDKRELVLRNFQFRLKSAYFFTPWTAGHVLNNNVSIIKTDKTKAASHYKFRGNFHDLITGFCQHLSTSKWINRLDGKKDEQTSSHVFALTNRNSGSSVASHLKAYVSQPRATFSSITKCCITCLFPPASCSARCRWFACAKFTSRLASRSARGEYFIEQY